MTENASMDEKVQKAATTLATMLDYLGLDATVKSQEKAGKISLVAVSEDAGRIIGRKGRTLEDLQLLINKMMQRGDENTPKIFIDVDGYSRKPADSEASQDSPRDGRREGRGPRNGDRGGDRGGRGGDRGGRGGFRDRNERGGGRDRGDRGDSRRGPVGDSAPRFSEEEGDAEHDARITQNALDAAKEVKRWGEHVTMPPMNSHDRRLVHVTLKDDMEIQTESRESDNPKLKSVVISIRSKDGSSEPLSQD